MKILISFLIILPFALSTQLFPHGKSAGDIALVVSNDNTNTLTTGDTDDGIKVITTPNIPFFQRRQNHKVQVCENYRNAWKSPVCLKITGMFGNQRYVWKLLE